MATEFAWKKADLSLDDTLDKMLASAKKLDPAKIQIGDIAGAAGAPETEKEE